METINPLLEIIRRLRGENGCAWDRKQTPTTMWKCLAEELYELEEAIVKDDGNNIVEELGDVLFQILFIMEIYAGAGRFSFDRVVNTVAEKMIRRHPHVYGDSRVTSEQGLNERRFRHLRKGFRPRQCARRYARAHAGPEGVQICSQSRI